MMRSLSYSHVPDSIGVGALAPCATHIRRDTQPPLFRLPSSIHDIHNIDITHKLLRTFFLKQFSYIYSYAVDSLNSSKYFLLDDSSSKSVHQQRSPPQDAFRRDLNKTRST